MVLKKCIGIISYLPDIPGHRQRRLVKLRNLLVQLGNLWPDIDILIVAQNWKDFKGPEIPNKIIKVSFSDKLGILEARKVLRAEFLKLDYDYIILMDDDCQITCDNETAHLDYIAEIDKHPTGLCFIHSDNHWHHHDDMARGPLNLCAISRDLFEKEPWVEVKIENNEAMEDDLYVELLYHKYPDIVFNPPATIRHTNSFKYMYVLQYGQYDVSPSTWFTNLGMVKFHQIWHNTNYVIECYEAGLFDLDKIKENKAKWQM